MSYLFLGLISWILIGLASGALARSLPGTPTLPWIPLLGSGLLGAIGGGLLATGLGFGGLAGFDPRSLITATLGAMLALLLLRARRLAA
jgi:uncharacterized membrane protein YeaQ/YmgE (transglycosylase-associated protein family)